MPSFTYSAINCGGPHYWGLKPAHLEGVDVLFLSEYKSKQYWSTLERPFLRAHGFEADSQTSSFTYDLAAFAWRSDKFDYDWRASESARTTIFDGLPPKARKCAVRVLGNGPSSTDETCGTSVLGVHLYRFVKESSRCPAGWPREKLLEYIVSRAAHALPQACVDGGVVVGGDFNSRHSVVHRTAAAYDCSATFTDDSILTTPNNPFDNIIYPSDMKLVSKQVRSAALVSPKDKLPHYPVVGKYCGRLWGRDQDSASSESGSEADGGDGTTDEDGDGTDSD